MLKAFVYILIALTGPLAAAQTYCSVRPENKAAAIEHFVAEVGRSQVAVRAFSGVRGERAAIYCSTAVALAYGYDGRGQVGLVTISVRYARSFAVLRQFRFLYDHGRVYEVPFVKSSELLAKWASEAHYKGAGALPRVDTVSLVESLSVFRQTNGDAQAMSAMWLVPPVPDESTTSLATWPIFPEMPVSHYAVAKGVIITRDNRTGDVSIAEVDSFTRDLILPLQKLAGIP
jgi:hypothetical protein